MIGNVEHGGRNVSMLEFTSVRFFVIGFVVHYDRYIITYLTEVT
ncbi:hypothetical protein [Paenibacillus polymyxa]